MLVLIMNTHNCRLLCSLKKSTIKVILLNFTGCIYAVTCVRVNERCSLYFCLFLVVGSDLNSYMTLMVICKMYALGLWLFLTSFGEMKEVSNCIGAPCSPYAIGEQNYSSHR